MKHTRIILLITLLGAAAVGLPSVRGATITVTEVGDGFGVYTNLRQALADANDGDTIEFAPWIGGVGPPGGPGSRSAGRKQKRHHQVGSNSWLPHLPWRGRTARQPRVLHQPR